MLKAVAAGARAPVRQEQVQRGLVAAKEEQGRRPSAAEMLLVVARQPDR